MSADADLLNEIIATDYTVEAPKANKPENKEFAADVTPTTDAPQAEPDDDVSDDDPQQDTADSEDTPKQPVVGEFDTSAMITMGVGLLNHYVLPMIHSNLRQRGYELDEIEAMKRKMQEHGEIPPGLQEREHQLAKNLLLINKYKQEAPLTSEEEVQLRQAIFAVLEEYGWNKPQSPIFQLAMVLIAVEGPRVMPLVDANKATVPPKNKATAADPAKETDRPEDTPETDTPISNKKPTNAQTKAKK